MKLSCTSCWNTVYRQNSEETVYFSLKLIKVKKSSCQQNHDYCIHVNMPFNTLMYRPQICKTRRKNI